MEIEENELRRIVYNLAHILCGGFNINILNSIVPENLTLEEANRIKTGYQCIKNNKIHWGIMVNTNIVVHPVAMHTDEFTVMLNHYDGVMVSKTRSEFILSGKYTGWYIIIESIKEVKDEF